MSDSPSESMPEGDRANLLQARSVVAWALGEAFGGRRNYYETFGWDRDPDIEDYYGAYLRNPYARACVDIPSSTAWRDSPEIVDKEDSEAGDQTQFEEDVEDFVEATRCWHYLERADKLQGIGEYGILLVGWADGEDQEFAEPVDQTALQQNDVGDAIAWFRPLSQLSIEKIRYGDKGSGRWARPEYYRVNFSDESATEGVFSPGDDKQWVHHERILHLAEGKLDDEVRGTPRMEPVFNQLTDLEKTLGSAPETAYSNARPGLHLDVDKDYQLEDGGSAQQEELESYVHDQQPFLRTQGTDVQRIAGETVDPTAIIQPLIQAISAEVGIPQSVLRGNETGERATSQDLKEWYGIIQERREQFVTPEIVKALFDELLAFGVLTPPSGGGFEVDWPPLAEENTKETSEVQKNRSDVIKNIQSAAPSLGTEAIVEYLETGEFPDLESEPMPEPEPMDLEKERDQMPNPPPTPQDQGQEPALSDGGSSAPTDE